MIKGNLYFSIKLGWEKTIYDNLRNLSVWHNYSNGETEFIFPIEKLKEVEQLVGKPIEIEGYRDKFKIQDVTTERWKGFSGFEVIEHPTIYRVIEHRKIEKAQGEYVIRDNIHDTPKELVKVIWKYIISPMPIHKPIKSKTIAENICKFLYIKRFFREDTNSFDFNKFFGNRKDYFTYFYYPMKVLVWEGKIRYHKSGKIERIV